MTDDRSKIALVLTITAVAVIAAVQTPALVVPLTLGLGVFMAAALLLNL
ncbi:MULTISPECIES: hypothetical protein [Actinomycetes]